MTHQSSFSFVRISRGVLAALTLIAAHTTACGSADEHIRKVTQPVECDEADGLYAGCATNADCSVCQCVCGDTAAGTLRRPQVSGSCDFSRAECESCEDVCDQKCNLDATLDSSESGVDRVQSSNGGFELACLTMDEMTDVTSEGYEPIEPESVPTRYWRD